MLQDVIYQAVENEMHTFDLSAVTKGGVILSKVKDVSPMRDYAENMAWLFTKNHMLPIHLEQVVEQLIGVLL